MSRNGSGTFTLVSGNPVSSGTTISSTWANNTLSDIASALTQSVSKDGQTTWTGNMAAGGYKITGLAAGTAATDSATLAQVQAGAVTLLGGVGGTADVITATASPGITAYAAGQAFRFVAGGANTGAVTINLNGLGARAITKRGATALAAGDIPATGALIEIVYDGTQFQLVNADSVTPAFTSVTLGSGANQTAITGTTDTRTSSTSQFPQAQYINTTADANSGVIQFLKSRAAGTTQSGDALWTIQAYGYAGAAQRFAGALRFEQSAAAGATWVPGRAVLALTNTSGASTDALTVTATAVNVTGSAQLQENSTRAFSRNAMAESGELGIANNTTYSYAHGFGAIPKLVMAVFRCKTAELGYAINDEIPLCPWTNPTSNVISLVWVDATNIYARINSSAGNNITIGNTGTNAGAGLTYANWRIVLRAWY